MMQCLAKYAVTEAASRQRAFAEAKHPYRSAFERDRDRIIHCSAFRRLEGKTQVFTPGLDDHYRTRLTHTIEVAQIARTVAKALELNQLLTEAVCLAHDLGHSPFGHTGESVLNSLMEDFGGFEHNRQSLRVVDRIEHPYAAFRGLNLMYETRLGLAKHSTPYDHGQDGEFPESVCSLEGQIADIADRIAYNCHDLEDGMRAGIINSQMLADVELFALATESVDASGIEDVNIRRTRISKTVMDILVSDCIRESRKAIAEAKLQKPDDVYGFSKSLITLSAENESRLRALEEFLLENFYLHQRVVSAADDIEGWLASLFEKFLKNRSLMPKYYQTLIETDGLERTVCDYIAGMTDRYCLKILREL